MVSVVRSTSVSMRYFSESITLRSFTSHSKRTGEEEVTWNIMW